MRERITSDPASLLEKNSTRENSLTFFKPNCSKASLVFLFFLFESFDTGIETASASVPVTSFSVEHEASGKKSTISKAVKSISSTPNALATSRLAQQGRELYEAGQFSMAVQVWQQAAQGYQNQKNFSSLALILSHLSLAYQQLGQWKQADGAMAGSLKLLQAEEQNPKNLQILAQTLNNQGSLRAARGQFENALDIWKKASDAYAQAGDRVGATWSLLNQAQALQALGLYPRALDTLNQVNKQLYLTPNSLIKVAGLRNLGNALRVVGDLEQSQEKLQQSLILAKELQSPQDVAVALLGLGNTARVQQNTKAALEFYRQAAAIKSTSELTKIHAQLNQLSLLLEAKQLIAARALSSRLMPQISKISANRAAVYAQINFAQSLVQLRKTDTQDNSWADVAQLLALAVKQARNIEDRRAEAYALGHLGGLYEQTQQWNSAKDLTQQALLLAQAVNAPDIAYRWQWQLGRILKVQGDMPGAIANYIEAVNALKSLRRNLTAVNQDVQFSFRDEVEPVYRQLVELLLASDNPSHQDLTQAREAIESLQLAELDDFFRVACLEGRPVQIDSVIDKEDPTSAVIYPIILADRLDVIIKLPGQPLRHYKTKITQNKVEQLLEQLQESLQTSYRLLEAQSLSMLLYNWLIRPAEADLAQSSIKTLVFVLDGNLRNIPMSALYDGQQYLIQKYAVALTPGLQLLPPQPITRMKLKALTAGLTESRQGFSALKNVSFELNQIKSQVKATTLLNEGFTGSALQKELEDPLPIVHLATHGQFSSQANQTFILAWDKPILVNELNGLLRSKNSLNNAIELLVLSACETATGDKRAALGLAGVAVRAGARSTIASLWSVKDESSALLMGHFYHELADRRVNKAEALRQAQLALLESAQYGHPQFWSAYVLVGNWL